MKLILVPWIAAVLPIGLAACASAPEGPVIPTPPFVEIQLDSTVITPEAIQFVGRVVIENQMRGPLQIEKIDYTAELHDKPFLSESFVELRPMSSRGTRTVTLPIRVSMKDLRDQLEDVLAEESVRVSMHTTVFPVGFGPIALSVTKVVPALRIPEVSFDGAAGNPLDGEFWVRLRVRNPNSFPLTFGSVESFVTLNGKRYDLLQSECFDRIAPGESGPLVLAMHQTRGKGLSLLINLATHRSFNFVVGGSIQCQTPHGLFVVPLEVSSSSPVAMSR